jgi:hypothetical protein
MEAGGGGGGAKVEAVGGVGSRGKGVRRVAGSFSFGVGWEWSRSVTGNDYRVLPLRHEHLRQRRLPLAQYG